MKRAQILEVAAEQFGRDGYEETKWADVAESVGIGSTALYHYFESKQHCLFEIIAKAVTDFREQFDRIDRRARRLGRSARRRAAGGFELTEWEILRLRVVTAEHGTRRHSLVAAARGGGPHGRARASKRDLEFAWGTFLARGMEQGLLPERSPRLLTRAVIGLYNSVWVWYRPGGSLAARRRRALLRRPPARRPRLRPGGRGALAGEGRLTMNAAVVGLGITEMGKIYGRSAADFAAEASRSPSTTPASRSPTSTGCSINGNGNADMEPRLQMTLGFENLTMLNVMNAAGSTSGAMVQYAALALEAGLVDHVVLVYADAPLKEDVGAAAAYASRGAWHGMNGLRAAYGEFGGNPPYALAARRHMHLYGTTSEQLGAIAVAQRQLGPDEPEGADDEADDARGPPELADGRRSASTSSTAASSRTALSR